MCVRIQWVVGRPRVGLVIEGRGFWRPLRSWPFIYFVYAVLELTFISVSLSHSQDCQPSPVTRTIGSLGHFPVKTGSLVDIICRNARYQNGEF
jgi:hypothetical protein